MSFLAAVRKEVRSLSRTFSTTPDRAFAIWAATILLDIDKDDAFDALGVEGSNEKGMDLFWIDQTNQKIFIAQCKYSPTGNHRPRVKDVDGLFACLDWLASPEALEREGRPELAAAAKDYQQAGDEVQSIAIGPSCKLFMKNREDRAVGSTPQGLQSPRRRSR